MWILWSRTGRAAGLVYREVSSGMNYRGEAGRVGSRAAVFAWASRSPGSVYVRVSAVPDREAADWLQSQPGLTAEPPRRKPVQPRYRSYGKKPSDRHWRLNITSETLVKVGKSGLKNASDRCAGASLVRRSSFLHASPVRIRLRCWRGRTPETGRKRSPQSSSLAALILSTLNGHAG